MIDASDFPLSAAVAGGLVVIPRTGSTNADAVAGASADPDAWPHLSVLLTDDQTDGRGRQGRSWTAPPGTAIAVSVVLRVAGLPVASRGWIPLMAGAAMTRSIAEVLRGKTHSVRLKWPNDVLVDGLKICGILAEATGGDVVVVGAGVNTTMTAADLPVPTAVSFAALGLEVDVDMLVAEYLAALAEQFEALVAAGGDAQRAGIHGEIEALCATIDGTVRISLPGGDVLEGHAVRIAPDGALVVESGGSEASVVAGDVMHVR